ncbi:hypothetical protein [Burkholderia glumae]|uniref:hypothetical protein n=1 Tax=Burkholderia glumae TaxID=337 RepID=UPI0003A31793|nr:hypothetical protein [Burkholderia glumae]MCM2493016.1 hypothetical protein [Burkholderia glumae]MCM2544295.1 hypothetical protein [Burkholderia glumae]MCR1765868.1 hypothetical protein [Burkholderia glumae]PJO23677.1 hypothetical protein Y5A_008410 [Burkholderia glumae AU6208]QHE11790.1 hypothetical protein GQR88_16185 [Burkholderia glumae AU6208]
MTGEPGVPRTRAGGAKRQGGGRLRAAAVCFLIATIASVRGFGADQVAAGAVMAARIVSVAGWAACLALFVSAVRRR